MTSSSSSLSSFEEISALLSPVSFETFMTESYAYDVRYIPGDASRVEHLQEAADLHKAFDVFQERNMLQTSMQVRMAWLGGW
jgi:hypothetical protein